MKKNNTKNNKKLDLSDIDTKIKVFEENINKVIETKDFKTPIQVLLYRSKDTIIKARQNKISYSKIAELIEESFKYKISPQTIRKFLEKEKEI